MEDIHRRTIQRNYKTLVDQTNLYSLLPKLLEKNVFSKRMLEPYTNSSMNETERKRLLFDDIETRGPQAWVKLLDSLQETGHSHLSELLKNDLALREKSMAANVTRTTNTATTRTHLDRALEFEPTPNFYPKPLSEMTTEELMEMTTEMATKENFMQFRQVLHPQPHQKTKTKKIDSALVIEHVGSAVGRRAAEAAAAVQKALAQTHLSDDEEIGESQQPQSDRVRMFQMPSAVSTNYQETYERFLAKERARKSEQQSETSGESSTSMQLRTSAPVAVVADPPLPSDNNIIEKFMNFSETPMKIVVRSSTRFYDDIGESKVPIYRMRGKRRGALLLINNMHFVNDCEPQRNGAHIDEQNMVDLFEQFGFEICRYRDLTLLQMRQVIGNFSSAQNEQLRGLDSVFVTVMSHGYNRAKEAETSVVSSDGLLLAIDWIVDQFRNENCPLMEHKPKVFLFQACRGENMSHSVHRIYKDGQSSNMPMRPLSDILIGYCTVPGYQSHRDTELGTWYIQIVCDVFMNHAHDTHIEDLLKIVDFRMSNLQTVYGTMQTAMYENWGFKTCFLHPNFYASGVVRPARVAASSTTATVPYTSGANVSTAHSSQLS